jgi:hypothetical protein
MLVVCTHPAKKRKESEVLTSCIERTSFEIFLCSEYEKQNTKYVVSNKENSSRCSEYVFCRASCDVEGILVRE